MKDKHGNLAKLGLPALLHLIYKKGDPAAVLDIVREPVKKRFFFKDGIPVSASSNILNEVLGRLLMQEGIITQTDYETSLEIVLKEKKRHGEVLISMGLLTEEQLNTFLTLQLKRRLWKIFGWNEGSYRYTKTEAVTLNVTHNTLHPASLILEGISLGFYPNQRIKTDLKDYLGKSFTAVPQPLKYAVDDFNLNLQEKRFLGSFDGNKNLKEVIEASDLLRHRALSLALSFFITGLIKGPDEISEPEFLEDEEKETRALETGGDSKLNAELLFMRARSALMDGSSKAALDMLREITDLNPIEGEYWAYFGWALFKDDPKKVKEAETIIKDAIDLNNDLDSAWYFLGIISLEIGNLDFAVKAFKTALSKNPWVLSAASELKRLEILRRAPALPDQDERDRYIIYYGFMEDPFKATPDSKYLNFSASFSDALNAAVKGIRKKSGPVLVTGPEGSGKTTLLLEILKKISDDKVLCAPILTPEPKELQLIKAINAEVGGTSESPSVKEQLLSFGMRVSQNKIQGGNTLIIIDQAEELTPGCLKLIQYLARLKAVQILLIAKPSFEEKLAGPDFTELNEKLKIRLTLSPLTLDETGEFIGKRLAGANPLPSGEPLFSFSGRELQSIFDNSHGLPALINQEAARMLFSSIQGTTETEPPQEEVDIAPSSAPESSLEEFSSEVDFKGGEEYKIELTQPPVFEVPSEEPPAFNTDPIAVQGNEHYQEATVQDEAPKEETPLVDNFPVEPHEEPPPPIAHMETKSKPIEAAPVADDKKPLPAREPVEHAKSGSISFAPSKEDGGKSKPAAARLSVIIIIIIVAGLIIGALAGIYWFKSSKNEESAPANVMQEDQKTAVPSPATAPIDQRAPIDTSAPLDASAR
ncbi:MAG: AAA family ATPase [Deltaproteobacteria bacterium]|nr:AAA family ATPase [Deltaproteobacteria bacterium]